MRIGRGYTAGRVIQRMEFGTTGWPVLSAGLSKHQLYDITASPRANGPDITRRNETDIIMPAIAQLDRQG
jgi:hypothetical protein